MNNFTKLSVISLFMFSIVILVVCETKSPLVPEDAQVFTWEKTFGKGGFYTGASVIETYDGGYVVAGTYTEGSESHIYLLKVSISGNKLWDTIYDESIYTSSSSVVEIPDKGFVIAGKRRMTIDDDDDVYLLKADSLGNKVWDTAYGGGEFDRASKIIETSDGWLMIVGTTYSFGSGNDDIYLIRTDMSGGRIWSQTFGTGSWECGYSVAPTKDGGFVMAGRTEATEPGTFDIYLVKSDLSGNKMYFGGSQNDDGGDVILTSDGGFAITGMLNTLGSDMYLINTDSAGNKRWEKTFGGSGYEEGSSIVQCSDGGYVIAGTSSFGGGGNDIYLVRTDSLGNKKWDKTFGGTYSEYGYSVIQSCDGGFVIVGTTTIQSLSSSVYLIKTDADGNVE